MWVFVFQKNINNFDYFHEAFSKTSFFFISEECILGIEMILLLITYKGGKDRILRKGGINFARFEVF